MTLIDYKKSFNGYGRRTILADRTLPKFEGGVDYGVEYRVVFEYFCSLGHSYAVIHRPSSTPRLAPGECIVRAEWISRGEQSTYPAAYFLVKAPLVSPTPRMDRSFGTRTIELIEEVEPGRFWKREKDRLIELAKELGRQDAEHRQRINEIAEQAAEQIAGEGGDDE